MTQLKHISVSIYAPHNHRELDFNDGQQQERSSRQAASAYAREQPSDLVRVFNGIKTCCHWTAMGLYLFPLFLVLKIFFWLIEKPSGDLLTLVFVGLVLLCFALLALLVLFYPLVGPAAQRPFHLRLHLPRERDMDEVVACLGGRIVTPTSAGRLLERASSSQLLVEEPVRLSGEAQPLDTGPLLEDRLLEAHGMILRLFHGQTFILRQPEQPLTMVVFESAPVFWGPYVSSDRLSDVSKRVLAESRRWLQAQAQQKQTPLPSFDVASRLALEAGEKLEITATQYEVVQQVDDFVVGGRRLGDWLTSEVLSGGPYRGGGINRGVLLRSTTEHPLLLRRQRG